MMTTSDIRHTGRRQWRRRSERNLLFHGVKSLPRLRLIRSGGGCPGDPMARITNMPRGVLPMWIHDVSHPVSWKWFQYRDDVLLVQYALNKVMSKDKILDFKGKASRGPLGPEYPPVAPLKIDG